MRHVFIATLMLLFAIAGRAQDNSLGLPEESNITIEAQEVDDNLQYIDTRYVFFSCSLTNSRLIFDTATGQLRKIAVESFLGEKRGEIVDIVPNPLLGAGETPRIGRFRIYEGKFIFDGDTGKLYLFRISHVKNRCGYDELL